MGERRLRSAESRLRRPRIQKNQPARHGARAGHRRQPRHDQANAILQYIADSHPAARLGAADGLEAQFEFNETMAFLTGDFHPAYWPMFSPARYTTDKTPAAHNAVAKPPTHASTAS